MCVRRGARFLRVGLHVLLAVRLRCAIAVACSSAAVSTCLRWCPPLTLSMREHVRHTPSHQQNSKLLAVHVAERHHCAWRLLNVCHLCMFCWRGFEDTAAHMAVSSNPRQAHADAPTVKPALRLQGAHAAVYFATMYRERAVM